jgi:hypothetical protein
MLFQETNDLLRMIFDQLEKDGYKKKDMCNLTLGNQCSPMFNEFVKGKDLGIKPLSRMFEPFGYELHLVPVPKKGTDAETSTLLEKLKTDFIETCKFAMIENLDNEAIISKARNKVTGIFKEVQDDLLAQVFKDD